MKPAVYRNAVAWNLHQRLGLPIEQYGRDGEFTRIVGVPEDLAAHWSKRRAAIVDAASDMGFRVEGNAARAEAANKITRAGKSPDNEPEVRHRRWRAESLGFVEREVLIVELLGEAGEITRERIRELTAALETLPERLTREEAVFRLPDVGRAGEQRHRGVARPGGGGDRHRAGLASSRGGAADPHAALGRGPGGHGPYPALHNGAHAGDGDGGP